MFRAFSFNMPCTSTAEEGENISLLKMMIIWVEFLREINISISFMESINRINAYQSFAELQPSGFALLKLAPPVLWFGHAFPTLSAGAGILLNFMINTALFPVSNRAREDALKFKMWDS